MTLDKLIFYAKMLFMYLFSFSVSRHYLQHEFWRAYNNKSIRQHAKDLYTIIALKQNNVDIPIYKRALQK